MTAPTTEESNTSEPAAADRPLLITIDGPAGAGKTTISRMLAARLDYDYIDTGALYRAVALAATEAGIAGDDDDGLAKLCSALTLGFRRQGDTLRLISNGRDVSDLIRTPELTMQASAISARPVVRLYLLTVQRELGANKKAVFEGRDMGTVVFPEADVKFFLDADLEIRAKRRFNELRADERVALSEVQRQMAERDRNDSTRTLAPLKPAQDAIRIDSTVMNRETVLRRMLTVVSAAAKPSK